MTSQNEGIKSMKSRTQKGAITLNVYMCAQGGRRGVEKLIIRCVRTEWVAPYISVTSSSE